MLVFTGRKFGKMFKTNRQHIFLSVRKKTLEDEMIFLKPVVQ